MKLSGDEVKKIAHLARIELKPAEAAKFQEELGQIIDYNARKLAQIKGHPALKLSGEPELGQPDEPRPSLTADLALANTKHHQGDFFAVPKVLED